MPSIHASAVVTPRNKEYWIFPVLTILMSAFRAASFAMTVFLIVLAFGLANGSEVINWSPLMWPLYVFLFALPLLALDHMAECFACRRNGRFRMSSAKLWFDYRSNVEWVCYSTIPFALYFIPKAIHRLIRQYRISRSERNRKVPFQSEAVA